MTQPSFQQGWYGPNTWKIAEIVSRARAIRCFPADRPPGFRGRAVGLVRRHFETLRALCGSDVPPSLRKIVFLDGDWDTLHQGQWGADPYEAWGNRWTASDQATVRWARFLDERFESSADAKALLRPPLWPVPGLNVCGEALIATSEAQATLARGIADDRDRCVAWALLCRAEFDFQEALRWELALSARLVLGQNPLLSLLALYELEVFPMGWVDDCYEVYVPRGLA